MRRLFNALQYGYTPLHRAAGRNSLAVAELLIRSGADVHARDEVSLISNISFITFVMIYELNFL